MNLKVLFAVQKDVAKVETAKQRAHALREHTQVMIVNVDIIDKPGK